MPEAHPAGSPHPLKPSSLSLKLWSLFFFIFPFLWHPAFLEAHSLRKGVFLVFLGTHLLLRILHGKKPIEFRPQPLDIILILFILIRVLSSGLIPPDPQLLVLCLETFMWECSLLLFYLLMRSECPTLSWWNQTCTGLLISLSTCALLQLLGIPMVREVTDGRLNSSLFHPNVLGLLTVSLGAFLFSMNLSKPRKVLSALGVMFLVLGSGSRNALFWMLCALFYLRPIKRTWLILIILLIPTWQFMRISKHPAEEYRSRMMEHFSIRAEVYKSTWNALVNNPLGMGAGQYSTRIHPHITTKLHEYFPNPLIQSLQKAHNLILETICESGWILGLWWIIALGIFWKIPLSPHKAAVWFLGLGSMFSIILNYPDGQIIFFLFLSGVLDHDQSSLQVSESQGGEA